MRRKNEDNNNNNENWQLEWLKNWKYATEGSIFSIKFPSIIIKIHRFWGMAKLHRAEQEAIIDAALGDIMVDEKVDGFKRVKNETGMMKFSSKLGYFDFLEHTFSKNMV